MENLFFILCLQNSIYAEYKEERIYQTTSEYFDNQNRIDGIIGWTLPIEVLSEFLCRTLRGSDESWKELVKMVR